MSFLEELEQNKGDNPENTQKSPRQLWESCFKYFKHFVSILQKDKSTFAVEFNFLFLNTVAECTLSGPYEIKRSQDNQELKLEISLFTQLNQSIIISRKDQRSAELLKTKLYKDHILSSVKADKNNQYYIELNQQIPSIFRLILKDEQDFYIEYKNICTSSNRTLRLPIEKINQDYMDELAKYLLGKNPKMYTESISNKEISKIRDKVALEKAIIAKREEQLRAILEQEKIEAEIKKANTFKEKSKRYLLQQSTKLKNTIIEQLKKLK